MKMTLLEMTQNILSAMDADEVNSIGDTVESEQVALEIQNAYFANFNNFGMETHYQLIQFDGLQNPTDYPNVVKTKTNVDHFDWIKYNVNTVASPDYQDVQYCPPKEFLDMVLTDVQTDGTRITVKDKNTDLPYTIRSDENPKYWTTFDNEHIVFNSMNKSLEDTIQESKIMAHGEVIPTWLHTDDFIPEIEAKHFPYLLSCAKTAAFVNYKGVSNAKEETRERRQRVWLNANKPNRYNEYKKSKYNFGRS